MSKTLLVIGAVNDDALREARLRCAIREGVAQTTLTIARVTREEFALDTLVLREQTQTPANVTALFGHVKIPGTLGGVVMDNEALDAWATLARVTCRVKGTAGTEELLEASDKPLWVAFATGTILSVRVVVRP